MGIMRVSIAFAKSQFAELRRVVEEGARIAITKHGLPVAELGQTDGRDDGRPYLRSEEPRPPTQRDIRRWLGL